MCKSVNVVFDAYHIMSETRKLKVMLCKMNMNAGLFLTAPLERNGGFLSTEE